MFTANKYYGLIFCIILSACGHKIEKYSNKSDAVELNKRAMKLVPYISNPDSATKAIALLEQATAIDTNYFLGHYNKLMFFSQLKQVNKSITTFNKLITLRPWAHDLYLTGGLLYECVNDTISSKIFFTKSVTICSAVLDTMSSTNSDYDMMLSDKAINLIMLGEPERASKILKSLYDTMNDESSKNKITSIMHKSKIQLVELFCPL